jgi:hypothetical protein
MFAICLLTLKYIDKRKRVQKYFNKPLLGLWDEGCILFGQNYQLKVELLDERRMMFGLRICVHKILHGLLNLPYKCNEHFLCLML